jgi:hypothetical protein
MGYGSFDTGTIQRKLPTGTRRLFDLDWTQRLQQLRITKVEDMIRELKEKNERG